MSKIIVPYRTRAKHVIEQHGKQLCRICLTMLNSNGQCVNDPRHNKKVKPDARPYENTTGNY